jgi:hypothetical protein
MEFGTYQLIDDNNFIILGDSQIANGFGKDLEEVADFLKTYSAQ